MRNGLRDTYFRRLVGYALQYKGLLALTITMGVVGLALTFVIPWLIGSAIDEVIAPDWVRAGRPQPPTDAERLRRLWLLVGVGAATAVSFGVVFYIRGHY